MNLEKRIGRVIGFVALIVCLMQLVCCGKVFDYNGKVFGQKDMHEVDNEQYGTKILVYRLVSKGEGIDHQRTPMVTYTRYDGSFTLYNLKVGSHLVEFHNTRYSISPIRLDVSKIGNTRAFTTGKDKKPVRTKPFLRIEAQYTKDYFEKKEPFNPLVYLKNPMVLFFGGSVIIMVLFSKFVDPEAMKEVQDQMKEVQDQVSQGGGLLNTLKEQMNPEPIEKSKKKKKNQ